MRRLAPLLLLLIATQLHAASEYPPSLHWRTITTDHFYIHYHQGEEDLARRAAGYAEGAHERLVPFAGWTPAERTHIILADHVDASNGSATPVPNNRIEIYVSAPGADPSSAIGYYDNWLNLVITHEYTHILHLDQARGFDAVMRRIFGRNVLLGFPNEWSPLWFIEGIATLAESEETGTGRLKGTYLDMVLRTAAIENRWASEAEAAGLGPHWPTGNTRYYYGAKFLSWLATTHGMDKLTQFMNNYSSNVVPFRVNASAEDVYGTDMETLWQQWSEQQQKDYRAELAGLGPITSHERLTKLGYETLHSLLSPDGSRVAYAHHGPYERATIRVRDLASGRDIASHAVNLTAPLSWSADGKSIAFSDLEFAGSFSLLSDIYVWDIGHGTRRITHGARLKDPAFAPDGRTVVAVENRAGRNRLVEVDLATGSVRPLVAPSDDRQFSEPAISHDGQRIAVAEWQNGNIDVVVYSQAGVRIASLTESLPHSTNASPRFSRDDRTIWFSSDITGITNVFAVASSGGEIRRLTNVYGAAFYPTSVDGKRFLYTDYSADGFDLASFDATSDYPYRARTIPTTVTGSPSPASPPRTEDRGLRTEDSAYSPWRSLRPRWWFPVISSQSVNGEDKPVFGVSTAGGDVLGRHSYEATITNRDYGVLYSYDRFYPTFTILGARFDDNVTSSRTFTETTKRLIGQMSVPWRTVQRQAAGSIGLVRDSIGGDIAPGDFQGVLQGFRLGAFFNNAHEYLYSISPEQGFTATVDYENLNESFGSDASLQEIRGDLRTYLTIPYARSPLGRHVVALRAAGARNSGDFVRQRELKLGGEGFGEFASLDLTNFPVRGYDEGTLRGQTVMLASAEYRFPLYEIERGPSTWPIFFNRIHGDVFGDAGRAGGQTIASTGVEVAADFIIGNFLPVRYRVGVAFRLRDPGKGDVQPYIAFGSSF